MNTQNRSNRISGVILLALVSFVAGLVLALRAPGSSVPGVVGALCIVTGLFLLLSRNLFRRDPAAALASQQIAAEHQTRMAMRTVGASVVLLGIAQFIPDIQMRTVGASCGAAVSMAGAFKVPKRFFAPKSNAR